MANAWRRSRGVTLLSALSVVGMLGVSASVLKPRATVPDLPLAVANNAVAHITSGRGRGLYSFMGIDSTRTWRGITRRAFYLAAGGSSWNELPPVPGRHGRLAALAFAVKGRIYLFGGYTVDSAGAEVSTPDVNIWEPGTQRWLRGTDIPVPVDDAVGGVWNDSLIYLVSGWHNTDNVADVQIYDPSSDRWIAATAFPGIPVFGATGSIAGNTIILIDGTRRNTQAPRYSITSQSWTGEIDPRQPDRIVWREAPVHPGPPRYRGAAYFCGSQVIFAGGTDNPYNYNGIGYDGRPSAPMNEVVAFDVNARLWLNRPSAPERTMDHRGLVVYDGALHVVGGMRADQRVSASVTQVAQCLGAR